MTVDGREIVGFASNDYLGPRCASTAGAALAEGARRYGAGSGGSHLLGGHSRAHAQLEDDLAAFSGGFVDNTARAVFLHRLHGEPRGAHGAGRPRHDMFSDALNHASLIDGARLSRAEVQVYPHADIEALAAMLAGIRCAREDHRDRHRLQHGRRPSRRSHDCRVGERHGAWLCVDDAHGFGVLGPQGRGALAHAALRSPHLIYVGTFGKAAGVAGAAFVARTRP